MSITSKLRVRVRERSANKQSMIRRIREEGRMDRQSMPDIAALVHVNDRFLSCPDELLLKSITALAASLTRRIGQNIREAYSEQKILMESKAIREVRIGSMKITHLY